MNEIIYLDRVSLWRRTQEEFSYDLKKTILSVIEGKYKKPNKRLIINDISLKISRGEKVGIIGSNGAGKSTLLKIICGILKPTRGLVRVTGRISPLIELGAGFDTELSVNDNIIMYGVMLGFSRREMRQRLEKILDFAELQDYALSPVKSLSSGMIARLGFAIATDIQPDILILDEVLAVGDERFRTKSAERMAQLWGNHVTIIVVSHSMDFILQSCTTALCLQDGQVYFYGPVSDAVDAYRSII